GDDFRGAIGGRGLVVGDLGQCRQRQQRLGHVRIGRWRQRVTFPGSGGLRGFERQRREGNSRREIGRGRKSQRRLHGAAGHCHQECKCRQPDQQQQRPARFHALHPHQPTATRSSILVYSSSFVWTPTSRACSLPSASRKTMVGRSPVKVNFFCISFVFSASMSR